MEQLQGAIMPGGPDFQAGMKYCPEGLPAPQCTIGMQAPQSPHCPWCKECRNSKWWLRDLDASRARITEYLHKRREKFWAELSPEQRAKCAASAEQRAKDLFRWG